MRIAPHMLTAVAAISVALFAGRAYQPAQAEEVPALSAAQIAALHRAQSDTPFRTLPAGETFRVVWPDGSSEVVRIVSQSDAHGARPVDGDVALPLGPIELEVQPVSTEAPRRDPSWMAESIGH